ncbi:MAG: tripartite tricarboxylate transporter substrate binding protein [Alphaproteobacteria bacterium]|nr:MAG: tripartite tricarboxylate transporter substrate binding protein [Alphaproteobacteria bacterium]
MRHVKDICGPVKSAARSSVCALLVALTGALLWHDAVTRAIAQESYPNRAVRMIVPFPAGGTADVLPRIVAEKLAEQWRQPVIIDNRAGAGGNIGAEAVASAPPDGYVLLASPPGPIAINDNLYKKLAFQPSKFEPVIVLGTVPNVLLVKPAFPAKTAAELIDYVKANPGKVSFASQGNGSTSHLSAMLFQKLTGTEMVHVPYRGTAPALQDIMGNHVDLFFDNLGSSLNLHNAGNLRILALGSPRRVPSLPDIPTLAEAGVDEFQSVTWFAVVAPPGTPAAIAQALNQAIGEVLQQPGVREQFEKMGVRPLGGSVAETKRFIAEERERWADVIRTTNVRIE